MVHIANYWVHVTDDGTVTLNGSTDCFPLSTDFTSKAYDLAAYYTEHCMIYLKCSDVTTAIVTKYQISIDGKNWKDGVTAITSMDNNEQWILMDATEKGANYIRINADNTNVAAATATVIISAKA